MTFKIINCKQCFVRKTYKHSDICHKKGPFGFDLFFYPFTIYFVSTHPFKYNFHPLKKCIALQTVHLLRPTAVPLHSFVASCLWWPLSTFLRKRFCSLFMRPFTKFVLRVTNAVTKQNHKGGERTSALLRS